MHLTIRLYGNLRKYAQNRSDRAGLDVAEGASIRTLLDMLGVPEDGWWMAAVNDRVVEPETLLNEGDLVEVFDPVGGGT